jgi:hypothetical protein
VVKLDTMVLKEFSGNGDDPLSSNVTTEAGPSHRGSHRPPGAPTTSDCLSHEAEEEFKKIRLSEQKAVEEAASTKQNQNF